MLYVVRIRKWGIIMKRAKTNAFTLIELLAVTVVIAVFTCVSLPMILQILKQSKHDTFQNEMYAIFDAATYYYMTQEVSTTENTRISISKLDLENQTLIGSVVINKKNQIVLENVSDGKYCANGTKYNLKIIEGNCEN